MLYTFYNLTINMSKEQTSTYKLQLTEDNGKHPSKLVGGNFCDFKSCQCKTLLVDHVQVTL